MRSIEQIKADIEECSVTGTQKQLDGFWLEWFRAVANGIEPDRLEAICKAERDGRCILIPCKRGDVCYETDRAHGIIKHTVAGFYAFDREYVYSDGKHIIKGLQIDTWATDDQGCAWSDHYSEEEWKNRILTRAEAEAVLAGEGGE